MANQSSQNKTAWERHNTREHPWEVDSSPFSDLVVPMVVCIGVACVLTLAWIVAGAVYILWLHPFDPAP